MKVKTLSGVFRFWDRRESGIGKHEVSRQTADFPVISPIAPKALPPVALDYGTCRAFRESMSGVIFGRVPKEPRSRPTEVLAGIGARYPAPRGKCVGLGFGVTVRVII